MGRTEAITVDCGPLSVISQEIKRPSYILVASCQSQWSKLSVNLYEKNLYYLMVTIPIHYPASSHFSRTDVALQRYLFLCSVASSLEKPLLAGYTYMCVSQGLQLNEIRLFLFTHQCRHINHITYREKKHEIIQYV